MKATVKNNIWTYTGNNLKFNGEFKQENKEFSGIWKQLTASNIWADTIHIKLTKK